MDVQSAEATLFKSVRVGLGSVKGETRNGHILLCALLWSTIAFLLIHRFVLASVVVDGQSMMPVLKPGDCRMVNCWLPQIRGFRRGDIVVVRDRDKSELIVKRIVGLPTDSVQVRLGRVYINDHLLNEAYLSDKVYTDSARLGNHTYHVAANNYFVLGDNRPVSDDSRYFGAVSRSDLVGLISQ